MPKTKTELKRVVIALMIIGSLLIGLFYISKTQAQISGWPDSTDPRILPPTTPLSQVIIQGGGSGSITGVWNNAGYFNTNTCSHLGPEAYAINNFVQTGAGTALQNVSYNYSYTFWGVVYFGTDTIQMLVLPSTYNLNCIINLPQVQWQAYPY